MPEIKPDIAASSLAPIGAAVLDYGGAVYNVKHPAIGCKGDASTHDDVGLQKFANLITTGIGVPAVAGVMPSGTYDLYLQVVFLRKAIILRGTGTGNPTNQLANPGLGTTIRWMGSAGISMIQVQDARNLYICDMYIQGNTTNPPLAGLEFFQGASDTVGVNRNLVVARILFGYLPWASGSGTEMTYCVAIDGTNANNQMHYFYDCQFNRPVNSGVYMPNPQSIWCGYINCSWDGNSTAIGLKTSTSTTLWNAQFGQCLKDIEINSTANVVVHSWNSENSLKIFDITADGSLHVFGGLWTITSVMQGFTQIAQALALTDNLTLQGVRVAYQITPQPPIIITGAYSPIPYTINIVNCKGLARPNLTLTGYGAPGVTHLNIQNDTMSIRRTLAGAFPAADSSWTTPIIYQAPPVLVGQNAAVASIATTTALNNGNKSLYRISGTITITTLGSGAINLQVTYTDDSGTARTCTIPLCANAGAFAAVANTADSYKGSVIIACNPNTNITVKTAGTFTGCIYNTSAQIEGITDGRTG